LSVEPPESAEGLPPIGRPSTDAGPLGLLPVLSRHQVRLERRLGPGGLGSRPGAIVSSLAELIGAKVAADRFEVQWRGSGLRRPGAIAQLSWPRLGSGTRLGLGIEPTLAHAIVDRLLGFERLPAEGRLQVTPVEWGILSFVLARALDRLDDRPGPLGPWDLTIDRVGPDPFDPSGLGPIVTWRWRVQVGPVAGSARLWLPESILAPWLGEDPPSPGPASMPLGRFADLTSAWRAEVGTVAMPRGLVRLRPGALLLIDGAPLRGTPKDPKGAIELVLLDRSGRLSFRARPEPGTAAARLILDSPMKREPTPRENHAMSVSADPGDQPAAAPAGGVGPADIPVTLTVELGRVSLPLRRLAELKAGDVLELGRHAREPVELTSGGRLIARGELVQVDTELGVRVTQVFL